MRPPPVIGPSIIKSFFLFNFQKPIGIASSEIPKLLLGRKEIWKSLFSKCKTKFYKKFQKSKMGIDVFDPSCREIFSGHLRQRMFFFLKHLTEKSIFFYVLKKIFLRLKMTKKILRIIFWHNSKYYYSAGKRLSVIWILLIILIPCYNLNYFFILLLSF
jgi:hypothetical protein